MAIHDVDNFPVSAKSDYPSRIASRSAASNQSVSIPLFSSRAPCPSRHRGIFQMPDDGSRLKRLDIIVNDATFHAEDPVLKGRDILELAHPRYYHRDGKKA